MSTDEPRYAGLDGVTADLRSFLALEQIGLAEWWGKEKKQRGLLDFKIKQMSKMLALTETGKTKGG